MVKLELFKKCPCGKIPEQLVITGEHHTPKYATVHGDCCGEWSIEFRNNYLPLDSHGCMKEAKEAWNDAKRSDTL